MKKTELIKIVSLYHGECEFTDMYMQPPVGVLLVVHDRLQVYINPQVLHMYNDHVQVR